MNVISKFLFRPTAMRSMRFALTAAWLLSSAASAVAQVNVPSRGPAASVPTATAPPSASPSATRLLTREEAERLAQESLNAAEAKPPEPPAAEAKPDPSVWELAKDGGPLMWPIGICSVLVVCFAVERLLALRRVKLMPPQMMRELADLARRPGGVDPRAAYRTCLKYPSTASTVIRAVLLKIGRPFAELEQTLKETSEREAAKLYKNVRPIELNISVAPLLGLLGTVQGMIMAFIVTSNAGVNKAENLSKGIYLALVTTFAGLCVAIPAAVFAHFFEGRIQALFSDLNEFVLGMLPQWERFEGKLRVSGQSLAGEHGPTDFDEHESRPSSVVSL